MNMATIVTGPRRCSGIFRGDVRRRGLRCLIRSAAFGAGAMMCLHAGDIAPAWAQQSLPDSENGRYALATVQGTVVRLDTRTGKVTTCKNGDGGWSCTVIPDEREAYDLEIGRLQATNDALKAQLAQRDPGKADVPKSADGERKLEIPLPSDRDVDRVMTFVENAWRRLLDIANRIQRGDTDRDGKL